MGVAFFHNVDIIGIKPMKGFPNQFADLTKITRGMQVLADLVRSGDNPKDDGIFGEALVRAGVAGTRHSPMDVEEYITLQRQLPMSSQSFRTTARALRELFRLLGFVDDSTSSVNISVLGEQAAQLTNSPGDAGWVSFWKEAANGMILSNDQGRISHPYQVLLNLIEDRPGISRAKCALAFEAIDDTPEERERLADLADLPEQEIIASLGVTQANWDNAKKVLPKFALQLADVVEDDDGLRLVTGVAASATELATESSPVARPRSVRGPRMVTSETIGRAGTGSNSEQVRPSQGIDAAAVAETGRLLRDRTRRHNIMVQELAGQFQSARLYEDPYDILAILSEDGYLVEVKTLDRTTSDEMNQVRGALGQLLYYEAYLRSEIIGGATIQKVACFENQITATHQGLLNRFGIAVIWKSGAGYAGDTIAISTLGRHLQLS